MASDDQSEHLSRLKAQANRSLRSFLKRGRFPTPGTGTRPRIDKRVPPTVPVRAASGTLALNARLLNGTVFLDDERSTRALAKEIKRLIAEDRRRGLNI